MGSGCSPAQRVQQRVFSHSQLPPPPLLVLVPLLLLLNLLLTIMDGGILDITDG